jgi:hypothetical protein
MHKLSTRQTEVARSLAVPKSSHRVYGGPTGNLRPRADYRSTLQPDSHDGKSGRRPSFTGGHISDTGNNAISNSLWTHINSDMPEFAYIPSQTAVHTHSTKHEYILIISIDGAHNASDPSFAVGGVEQTELRVVS